MDHFGFWLWKSRKKCYGVGHWVPSSAYTTDGLHKDHKELRWELVDSERNLARMDLQGFKAKTLRLGINGCIVDLHKQMDSTEISKSYDAD